MAKNNKQDNRSWTNKPSDNNDRDRFDSQKAIDNASNYIEDRFKRALERLSDK